MTPEAQRIAIAEACGFKEDPHRGWWRNDWRGGDVCMDFELPDYPADLNAMHEAEGVLAAERFNNQRHRYPAELAGIIGDAATRWDVCHATAAQRAEAFLRTIGKWQETAPAQPTRASS